MQNARFFVNLFVRIFAALFMRNPRALIRNADSGVTDSGVTDSGDSGGQRGGQRGHGQRGQDSGVRSEY